MEQEMNVNPEGQRNKHFTPPQMLPNMPHYCTVHHDLPKSIIEYQTSLGRTNYGFTLPLLGENVDSRSIQVNHGSVPPSTRSFDDPTAIDTNYFAAPAVRDGVNNPSTFTNRQAGHPSVGLGSQRYDFTAHHNRKEGHQFFGDITAEDSLKVDGHGAQLSCLACMVNDNRNSRRFSFKHGGPETCQARATTALTRRSMKNRAKTIGTAMISTEIVDEAYVNVTYVPSSIGAGNGLEDLLRHTHYEGSSHSPETVNNSSALTNIAFIHPSLRARSQGYGSAIHDNHIQGYQRFEDTSTQDNCSVEGHDTLNFSAHGVFGPDATIAGNLDRNLLEPHVHKAQELIIGSTRYFLNIETYNTQLESWVHETIDANITFNEKLEKYRWIDWK